MSRPYSAELGPSTPRMRDVARLSARGLPVGRIAVELGIAEATVRTIRSATCSRVGAPSYIAAVVILVKRGEL